MAGTQVLLNGLAGSQDTIEGAGQQVYEAEFLLVNRKWPQVQILWAFKSFLLKILNAKVGYGWQTSGAST
jgi:hypothetical protein